MANDDLKRAPHHHKGDETWWWYEEPEGICVVVETGAEAALFGRHHKLVTIPWKSIRAALKRKDAPSQKKDQ